MYLGPTKGYIYYPEITSIIITGNTIRWYVGRSYFLSFSLNGVEITSESSTSSPALQLNISGGKYNYLAI